MTIINISIEKLCRINMKKSQAKPPFKGSCLCGDVTYSVDKIEDQMAHCHCSMCRKFHGAAFATFGEAKVENFRWLSGQEQLKEYVGHNGSRRLFCNHCGSSLVFIPSFDNGSFVEFALGTLDTDIPNQPDAHIFTSTSVCWNEVSDTLPQYRQGRGTAHSAE